MPTTLASLLDSILLMGVGDLAVAVAFPDITTFASQIKQSRSVPGCSFASVGRTVTGEQLFVHTTLLSPPKLASLDAGAIWQAAYALPVPQAYRALLIPNDPMARFHVLSIVAVLIPLVPSVEQKVRDAIARHPGGSNAVAAARHRFPDGSVRFSPLR